jgi:hypothetical protein
MSQLFNMVLSLQQITDAALHLPERDRLGVTAALWKSLGGNDEALADIQALARAHELDSGQVQPKSHADVFRNARAALG